MTDIERALDSKLAPWTEIEYRCKEFWVFRRRIPAYNEIEDSFKALFINHASLIVYIRHGVEGD